MGQWWRRWTGPPSLPVSTFILLEKELEQEPTGAGEAGPSTPKMPPRSPAPTHLHRRGCGGRGRLAKCSGPLSFTGLLLIFLPLLDGGGLPGGGGPGAPARLPSWALGCLAAAGVRRQVSGQWVMDVVGRLAVICREEGVCCRQAEHPSPAIPAPSPSHEPLSPLLAGQSSLGAPASPSHHPLTFKVFLPIAAAWLLSASRPSLLQDLLKPLHTQSAVKFIVLLFREPRRCRAQALWLRLWGRRGGENTQGLIQSCLLRPHPVQCWRSRTPPAAFPSNARDPDPRHVLGSLPLGSRASEPRLCPFWSILGQVENLRRNPVSPALR